MARTSIVSCDWCGEEITISDEETTVEQGWKEVAEFNYASDEILHRDFCATECLVSYYK